MRNFGEQCRSREMALIHKLKVSVVLVVLVLGIGCRYSIRPIQSPLVRVQLDWDANPAEEKIEQYHIYRSTVSGSGYAVVGIVNVNRYRAQMAMHSPPFFYVISAVNSAGAESGFSEEVNTQ